MTAREHAEHAGLLMVPLGKGFKLDTGKAEEAMAHALTAIALVMTDADSIDYATIAASRADHIVARHLNDAVRKNVDEWAKTPAAQDLIAGRAAEYLERRKDEPS